MASDRGGTPPQDSPTRPDSGAEWRWRNYTNYLAELGYDLGNGSAEDDASLEGALSDYLSRRSGDRQG